MLAGNYTDEDGKTIAPADANEAIAILLELFPGNKDYINTYIKPLAN
jgi:hypothetical protein